MIEKTLVVLKPDTVSRGLSDQVIAKYEQAGLKVVKRKEFVPELSFMEKHYAVTDQQVVGMGQKTLAAADKNGTLEQTILAFSTDDPKKIGMEIRKWLLNFMTSGKVVALILEGEDAIKLTRKVTGFTDPANADEGTVRKEFGEDSIDNANKEFRPVHNLVHASGDAEEAMRELALWFGEENESE